jgi:hypothetical protein
VAKWPSAGGSEGISPGFKDRAELFDGTHGETVLHNQTQVASEAIALGSYGTFNKSSDFANSTTITFTKDLTLVTEVGMNWAGTSSYGDAYFKDATIGGQYFGGGGPYDVSDISGVVDLSFSFGNNEDSYRAEADVTIDPNGGPASGTAYVEWPAPNDIYRWDSVLYLANTAGSGTVDVYVEADDGTGFSEVAGPVGRGSSIDVKPGNNVRFRVELSKTATSDVAELDAIYRRYVV